MSLCAALFTFKDLFYFFFRFTKALLGTFFAFSLYASLLILSSLTYFLSLAPAPAFGWRGAFFPGWQRQPSAAGTALGGRCAACAVGGGSAFAEALSGSIPGL